MGYGRNQTISQSKGDYICFCDADDIMEPGRIVTQLQLAIDNPNAVQIQQNAEGSMNWRSNNNEYVWIHR